MYENYRARNQRDEQKRAPPRLDASDQERAAADFSDYCQVGEKPGKPQRFEILDGPSWSKHSYLQPSMREKHDAHRQAKKQRCGTRHLGTSHWLSSVGDFRRHLIKERQHQIDLTISHQNHIHAFDRLLARSSIAPKQAASFAEEIDR